MAANLDLSFFARKRIVVTGASGYLAHSIVGLLSDEDCTIVRFSRSGKGSEFSGRAELVDMVGDYGRPEDVQAALADADLVFHLAAQTSVYKADFDPLADQKDNVSPVVALLHACERLRRPPGFVLAGTVTEAGIPDSIPVSEAGPDLPVSVYDLHKLIAELYVDYYARRGFVRGTTLRLPNIYGPGPKSSSAARGVLNLLMRRALAGEPLSIYGDGSAIRDYLFVADAARAFLAAASHPDTASSKHYVLGSGEGTSIVDAINLVADQAEAIIGKRPPVVHVESPPGLSPIEGRDFVADTGRFRAATGWRATVALKEGIARTLKLFASETAQAQGV